MVRILFGSVNKTQFFLARSVKSEAMKRKGTLVMCVLACHLVFYSMHLHKPYGKTEITSSRNFTNGKDFIRDRIRRSKLVVSTTFNNKSCAIGDHLHFLEFTPILTLFTTLRDVNTRRQIHNNTVANWSGLLPFVQPVLFILPRDNPIWIRAALDQGWKVERSVRTRSGIPVLKDMFKVVASKHRSPFLGFANADDLFGASLILTLLQLSCSHYDVIHDRVSLIVGRRRNIDERHVGSDVSGMAVDRKGKSMRQFHGLAQDYFIVSRHSGFCWENVPDFVVGRYGYDNWLITMAQQWNVTLVDASATITVLHQVGKDGFKSGSTQNHGSNARLNTNLIPGFRFGGSDLRCSPWRTWPVPPSGRHSDSLCGMDGRCVYLTLQRRKACRQIDPALPLCDTGF